MGGGEDYDLSSPQKGDKYLTTAEGKRGGVARAKLNHGRGLAETLANGGTIDPSDPRNHEHSLQRFSELGRDLQHRNAKELSELNSPSKYLTKTVRNGGSNTYVKRKFLNPEYVEWLAQESNRGNANRVTKKARKNNVEIWRG